MKKLLKAPVGVQLSALFLVFMLVLFVLTAPWQLVIGLFGILMIAISVYIVLDYFINKRWTT